MFGRDNNKSIFWDKTFQLFIGLKGKSLENFFESF